MDVKAKEDDVFVNVVERVGTDDWEKGGIYIPQHLKIEDSLRNEVSQVIADKSIDIDVAVAFLRSFVSEYELDQHISIETMDDISQLLESYSKARTDSVIHGLIAYYYVFYFHSPYLEVRQSVPNTDDPDLPVETFRAWCIGILLLTVFSTMNQFFSLRFPRIYIDSVCVQVLSYPMGKLFERILPTRKFRIFGYSFSLNPGPFNQKEHMLLTVMANAGLAGLYSPWIFEVQILKKFFDQPWARNKLYQYCITISMNFMGYGLAGLARSCLVAPDYCIWPINLATIVLNRSLHEKRSGSSFQVLGRTVTRYRYLLLLGTAYFIWYIIGPGYSFGALDNFNWPTWINPKSKVLAFIFGSKNGLGLNPISTFDWSRASQLVDPIILPYFTILNLFGGMIFAGIFVMMPLWFLNVWYSGYLPFNENRLYDRMGKPFDIKKIIDERANLDIEKFRAYSPLYATVAYTTMFGFYFACYSASVMHALLFHSRQIWSGLKALFSQRHRREHQKDVHNRLMRAYPDVPQLWYVLVYVVSFVMAAVALAKFLPEAPVWLLVFASGISAVLLIPLGVIQAVTGVNIHLNVISELVGGFVVPGKAIAMNMFKSYGCMCLVSGLYFSCDLKLGHYAKVPPRSMFRAQLLMTLLSVFTQLGIMNWQLDNIKDICEDNQRQKFVCVSIRTFFASSVIWGTIGPERMYGSKGLYGSTLYAFLIGAILPIPVYLLSRWKYPRLRHFYTPSILMGGLSWAPTNFSFMIPAVWIGYLFNVFIKKRHMQWWGSFNYITSCALTLGASLASIFCFFALSFWGIELNWWGNEISNAGIDIKGYGWYEVPDGGFGPRPGEFQ